MEDIYKAHLKAGYPGHDSMRENALREFDGELKAFGKEHERPGSFSAPSRTPMRLYKKGGHIGTPNGGSLTNLHMPKKMGYGHSLQSQPHIEKGNKMSKFKSGGHFTEVYGHDKTFKSGGSMKKYASGGSVYENEMLGERSSHRMPHLNYESQMRGEHCMNKAGRRHEDHMMHEHPSISGLKRGGRTMPKARFAAGGVAKVRHNQSTMSGKQITNAPNKVKVY